MDDEEKTSQDLPKQDEAKEAGGQGKAQTTSNSDDGVSNSSGKGGHDVIQEARAENDRREKILDREEALQMRKEKLEAEQIATGRGQIVNSEPPKKDPKSYGRSIMEGKIPDGD